MGGAAHCQREGCSRIGKHYFVICVPALADAQARHPLRMMVDLPLCRDHVDEVDVFDFLDDTFRARVRVALMQQGRAMPDFARAWKERGRIGDAHWNAFQEAKP